MKIPAMYTVAMLIKMIALACLKPSATVSSPIFPATKPMTHAWKNPARSMTVTASLMTLGGAMNPKFPVQVPAVSPGATPPYPDTSFILTHGWEYPIHEPPGGLTFNLNQLSYTGGSYPANYGQNIPYTSTLWY
jgi:hypothetical protein